MINAPRLAVAILASNTFVAAIAWLCGWTTGRLFERRAHEVLDLCDRVLDDCGDFLDLLAEPEPPYDWASADSGLRAPTEDVFEWPGGITVRHRYPPPPNPA